MILNGAPRSGKSSIVKAIQDTFPGIWMNLGVDVFKERMTPDGYQPGIGLRPGEPDHPVYPLVSTFYAAMYDAIAALSRAGLDVVVDVGHHDAEILSDCARRLEGLRVLFVGVRCPIEVIMERRGAAGPAHYRTGTAEDPFPAPVRRWQEQVHSPGVYDLEVDTSVLSAEECAEAIRRRLDGGPPPSAFRRLAEHATVNARSA